MKPLSLTARISLLFAGVVAAVLLGTGILIANAVENHFADEDRDEMLGKLELVQHLLDKKHGAAEMVDLSRELDDALVGHPGLSLAVIDSHGETWFATSGAAFPKQLMSDREAASGQLKRWTTNGTEYRGMARPITVAGGATYTVAISLDIMHHLRFMAEFRRILATAMVLAAIAAAALGWLVTRRSLRPLHAIAGTAGRISAD